MKKIISGILAVIMIIAMTACANDTSSVPFEEVRQIAEKQIPDISLMLGCEWDAEGLPEDDFFLMIANARNLYERDHGEAMPTVAVAENDFLVSEGIKIDLLIPTITKYFPFSEQWLRDSFENSLRYDAQNDALILEDGWGWYLFSVMHDITDNQDGTYDISYGMYTPQDTLEYTGVVKAKVHPDGYMQFISNSCWRIEYH